jgi:hypothetical protein
MQGRKVHEQRVLNNQQINVEHLSNGVYYYQISQNNQLHNGKLVIQKM